MCTIHNIHYIYSIELLKRSLYILHELPGHDIRQNTFEKLSETLISTLTTRVHIDISEYTNNTINIIQDYLYVYNSVGKTGQLQHEYAIYRPNHLTSTLQQIHINIDNNIIIQYNTEIMNNIIIFIKQEIININILFGNNNNIHSNTTTSTTTYTTTTTANNNSNNNNTDSNSSIILLLLSKIFTVVTQSLSSRIQQISLQKSTGSDSAAVNDILIIYINYY